MEIELTYKGQVLVVDGVYKGYNGYMFDYCVDYVQRKWLCLVQFYVDGDIEAIPFHMVRKINVTRI
jgi:hypothetical protein